MNETIHTTRRYEIISDEAEFRALQPEWDTLWAKAQGYCYQSFAYCWLAWKHVSQPHGRKLKCIVCREDGKLVMVWPFEAVRRSLWSYLVPLGPEGGDFTSVLVEANESAAELIAGAWDVVRRRCGADFIHLPYVRERLELYKLVMRERRILFKEAHNASAARLRGQGSWEEYCQTLGTLFRKRPGGFAKRLSKEGKVVVRMLDPTEESETASIIAWMFRCKRTWSERVGKRSVWLDSPEFERFLCKLINSGDMPSMARLFVVTLDDAPVAALIVSTGQPWASGIIAGFDPKYGKFCPGLIALEQCVKWAFDSGYDLDFGVGTEDFKSYWSRGEATTAWTVQTINSTWGLAAIRARRLTRELMGRIRSARRRGTVGPQVGNADSALTPAVQSSESLSASPD